MERFSLLQQRPQRDWFKVRYLYADARRFANQRGLIIRGPQKIFDSRLALISGLYAERHGRFCEYSMRVFERFFRRTRAFVLAAKLRNHGLKERRA